MNERTTLLSDLINLPRLLLYVVQFVVNAVPVVAAGWNLCEGLVVGFVEGISMENRNIVVMSLCQRQFSLRSGLKEGVDQANGIIREDEVGVVVVMLLVDETGFNSTEEITRLGRMQ